jgi:hypothetical protein
MNREKIVTISKEGMCFALDIGKKCMGTKEFRFFKRLLLDHLHKAMEPQLRKELEGVVAPTKTEEPYDRSR